MATEGAQRGHGLFLCVCSGLTWRTAFITSAELCDVWIQAPMTQLLLSAFFPIQKEIEKKKKKTNTVAKRKHTCVPQVNNVRE